MPTLLGRGRTIVGASAKSNNRPRTAIGAEWCEAALGAAVFILPGLLALEPRGAAALAIFAGLCGLGLVLTRPAAAHPRLVHPAALLCALAAWGALSAIWSIDPGRSLVLAGRLAALFAAGLALAAAAPRIARPHRLVSLLLAGTALGVVLATIDLATGGGLNGTLHDRPYRPTEVNQLAVAVAILVLPVGGGAVAALARHGRR